MFYAKEFLRKKHILWYSNILVYIFDMEIQNRKITMILQRIKKEISKNVILRLNSSFRIIYSTNDMKIIL